MAIAIEIRKNQPTLNSFGQYKSDDNGNSSESGVENNKFLDDDLYTTSLSSNVNEDIINNKYVLTEPSNIKLKVVIKNNGVSGETKSIRFRVALIDESVYDDITNNYNGWTGVTSNTNYKILETTYGQQSEGWPSGGGLKLLDNEMIINDFGGDDNGTYLTNFSNYQSGYNLNGENSDDTPLPLNIDLDAWDDVTTSDENQAFYVVVFSQGHKDQIVGTDVRNSRVQVFKFEKRWFKYDSTDDDVFTLRDCYQDLPAQDSHNCQEENGGYYQKRTEGYQYIGEEIHDYEGDQSGGGADAPAFNCSEVQMDVTQVVITGDIVDKIDESQYAEIIQYSNVIDKNNLNFYNFNPYRVISYNRLDEFDIDNDDDKIVDFTPSSYAYTTDIDLQLHYVDDEKVFKTSAPGFVNLQFQINKVNPRSFIIDYHEDDDKSAFAFFVLDWNDRNKKFTSWEDVVDDFPQSFSELFKRQEDNNTYILSGIKQSDGVEEFSEAVSDFAPYVNISNFYQTSGLKTIKSVVFSYGKCDNGNSVQALRWKLVTTRIFLNQNRITKQDFSELGTIGFTTIPWPYTTPIISGISKLSKYYDSVENTLYNNKFADDEVNSEVQIYNALINDELGDSFGDIDVEQTRLFIGAYDMDYLLMLYDTNPTTYPTGTYDENYNPYDDFNYWDGENVFYPLQTGEAEANSPESCVGLIFIGDSSNTTLKRNCLIELNMGDIENDKIIDTSGNKNTGIMIGDYSVQKRSTLVPLTREMNMKLPETDTEDKAI